MALPPGTRIGGYEIVSSLGAGGMGEVYRARDAKLKREVALKVLAADMAASSDRLSRLRREAQLLASLNHPNIAQIHGLEEQGNTVALIMELIEGEDLSRRLASGPIALEEALLIARQISSALEDAHSRGIVHRDLKPANIKLRPDGVVKVLDFGLAKSIVPAEEDMPTVTVLSMPGAIMGTPAYMSPEQVRGEETNQAADIWAFGVVLYQMLTGLSPFARHTQADTLAQVITAKPDDSLLPEITPGPIRRLIRNCLERDPARRWRSIADARIIIEESITMPADPRQAGVTARPTRRGALAGAGGALLSAGFAAGLYLDRRLRRASIPRFRRVTFRRGLIRSARFAPDGQTLLYGALWESEPCRVHTLRVDSPESRPLDLPGANLLAVSRTGELAISLGPHDRGVITYGTLARVAISGGAPREIVENVKFADWSPDGADLAIVRRVPAGDQLEYPIGKVVAAPMEGAAGIGFARISPDGKRVAFVRYTTPDALSGRVAITDSSGQVKELSPEYVNLHGLAWHGDEIFFTASTDRPLTRTLHAVRPGAAPRGLIPAGQNITLWDSFASGELLTAFTDDRAEITVRFQGGPNRELSWLDASALEDISSDGRKLLFTEYGAGGGARFAAYIRDTDGSAATRLGPGRAVALSPDQRSAICAADYVSPSLEILPVGPGDPKTFRDNGFTFVNARYLPDSKHAVISGRERGGHTSLYLMDLSSGQRKVLTKEKIGSWTLSPDRSTIAFQSTGYLIRLMDIASMKIREIAGVQALDSPIAWIASGILVARSGDPATPVGEIFLVDPLSGHRTVWKNVLPHDRAGIMGNFSLRVTPDGLTEVSGWHRALSNLHIIDGLT